MSNSSVVLFFVDGLGIGERNEYNPFTLTENVEPLGHFVGEKRKIFGDGILVETDARLGVDGRPQSASGQTAIYTGINAPRFNGGHKQGFPNQTLRDILLEHSIFRQLEENGVFENVFANAYTPAFFENKARRKSATTCAVEASKVQFRRLSDLLGRKAIFHDFTNRSLIENGFRIPEYTTIDVAEILSELAHNYRFTLYEHFITDKIGHARDLSAAKEHLPSLAEFVREALARIDLEETTFILTSDHGNIENLSIRNHTLNKVPTIVWGRKKQDTARRIKDLTDITPAIINLLTE